MRLALFACAVIGCAPASALRELRTENVLLRLEKEKLARECTEDMRVHQDQFAFSRDDVAVLKKSCDVFISSLDREMTQKQLAIATEAAAQIAVFEGVIAKQQKQVEECLALPQFPPIPEGYAEVVSIGCLQKNRNRLVTGMSLAQVRLTLGIPESVHAEFGFLHWSYGCAAPLREAVTFKHEKLFAF